MVCRARPASNPTRWAAPYASGRARVVPLEGSLTMPSNLIEWAIFIGAGIALGLALFLGLSA